MLLPLTLGAALAAPPVVEVRDGRVRGVVEVARPPAEVRGLLADPVWVNRTDGSSTTVTGSRPDGDCLLADYHSPSRLVSATYTVRQCGTPTGWTQTLVRSDLLTAYETEWVVAPAGSGSRISYSLRVEAPMLPTSWVLSMSQDGVTHMLGKLQQALGAPGAPAP